MAIPRYPHLSLRWGFFVAYASLLAADARDCGQLCLREHPLTGASHARRLTWCGVQRRDTHR